MLLTKGVELSGYFDVLGAQDDPPFQNRAPAGDIYGAGGGVVVDVSDQRCCAVYCCSADHHPEKLCAIPVNRLIIFEALAVNAGSLLTPIGNPQNILMWGRSGLSFTAFTGKWRRLRGHDADAGGAVLVQFPE